MEKFHVSKVVIIDSLDEHEFQTGELLETAIRHEFEEHNLPLSVERHSLTWAGEFEAIINLLAQEAESGYPILHIEMHGDKVDGLIFKNGSNLQWEEVTGILARLNRATKFNLVCVFAACYGAYFTHGFWVNYASPCLALIAPEEELSPDEVYRGFRTLYRNLAILKDMGKAADLLDKQAPIKGGWFQMRADIWFYEILRAYVLENATDEAITWRAMEFQAFRLELASDSITLKDAKSAIFSIIRKHISHLAFEKFFMIEEFPENSARFEEVRKKIAEDLLPLIGHRPSITEKKEK